MVLSFATNSFYTLSDYIRFCIEICNVTIKLLKFRLYQYTGKQKGRTVENPDHSPARMSRNTRISRSNLRDHHRYR